MLVIVAFQGPYNLSFDYPKESKGKLAFSSWLVTTQSWKCSVTAAYSSGAPVIAIFECQIGETLTFYHERGQKHCKNLHKTAKSQHGWKTVCQKWVVHVDIPPTQTLPFLDPTTQPLGGEGAPPACSPGYTKGLPGQKLQETIFFLPSLYAVSTSIHSVHQGLCVCNMVIRLYIYIICLPYIRKQAQQQCTYYNVLYSTFILH